MRASPNRPIPRITSSHRVRTAANLATGLFGRSGRPAAPKPVCEPDWDIPAGTTELMIASAYGKPETVRELLRKGADMHALDEHGHNALFWGLRWDRTASALELLRSGSPITDDVLCGPVRSGNTLLVEELINKQANPNAMFRRFDGDELWPDGETLLGFAVSVAGILEYPQKIIDLLVHAGANVNQPTQWFAPHRQGANGLRCYEAVTPLQVAAIRGMPDVMKLLWKAGAKQSLREAMACSRDIL